MKKVVVLEYTDLEITIRSQQITQDVKAVSMLIASAILEKTQELGYGNPKITHARK